MEFISQLFGEHPFSFHLAGFVFTLAGIFLVKKHFWERHKAQCQGVCTHPQFSRKKWLSENWMDVVETILVSFLFVRFSDVLLHWNGIDSFNILGVEIPTTGDAVFYYLFVAMAYQYWAHKRTRNSSSSVTPPPGIPTDPNPDDD